MTEIEDLVPQERTESEPQKPEENNINNTSQNNNADNGTTSHPGYEIIPDNDYNGVPFTNLSTSSSIDTMSSSSQKEEPKNNEQQSEKAKLFDVTQPPEVVQPQDEDTRIDSTIGIESSTIPSCAIPDIHENELDQYIEQLVYKCTPPPPELRNQIMQLIERRRVEAVVEGDYDTAEQQDKIASMLNSVVQAEQQKQNEDKTIDKLYGRWQQLTKKQNQIAAKWDKKIQDFIAESDQQKMEMDIAHEQEIDNFLAKWKDPTFLRPFNKPSARLLQLREQEKAMAISRMYAQAKEMKAVADKVQREETQAAQAKIGATMTAERNKLAAKQNKEISTWKTYRNRMIKSMQNDKQKELRPVVTALQQIKAKKTVPNRHVSILPNLPNNRSDRSEAGMSEASNLNYSPRTQAIYTHFRSEKKTTLLDVGPVDDQLLMQMKKPPTGRARSTLASRGPTVKRTPNVSKRLPTRK